ncbi:MAG: polymerase sigma-70 factor, subfamily [Mycobacterium sp.]|jgi:hypothetical protein|nr:polymerase sigma-70 factor, subfamily [Mycobacterium sp.]
MKALYAEHASVCGPTHPPDRQSDPRRNLVQETLLRGWKQTDVIADTERSARARLFTVDRNINRRREPHAPAMALYWLSERPPARNI